MHVKRNFKERSIQRYTGPVCSTKCVAKYRTYMSSCLYSYCSMNPYLILMHTIIAFKSYMFIHAPLTYVSYKVLLNWFKGGNGITLAKINTLYGMQVQKPADTL